MHLLALLHYVGPLKYHNHGFPYPIIYFKLHVTLSFLGGLAWSHLDLIFLVSSLTRRRSKTQEPQSADSRYSGDSDSGSRPRGVTSGVFPASDQLPRGRSATALSLNEDDSAEVDSVCEFKLMFAFLPFWRHNHYFIPLLLAPYFAKDIWNLVLFCLKGAFLSCLKGCFVLSYQTSNSYKIQIHMK